jgi:hypothetical protein
MRTPRNNSPSHGVAILKQCCDDVPGLAAGFVRPSGTTIDSGERLQK